MISLTITSPNRQCGVE